VQYIPLTTRRITGIVSRGGAILAEWMVKTHKQSRLYEHFEDICKILKKHDVSFSLGDGLSGDSGPSRTRFRSESERRSGLKSNSIPV